MQIQIVQPIPQMLRSAAFGLLLFGLLNEGQAGDCWGRLANPGFDGDRIKTTLFFAGQANDGSQQYECGIGYNLTNYTLNPVPRDTHLNWSNPTNRAVVMNLMMSAGINVISMSSWGEDFLTATNSCTNGWVTGAAPMQTSPQAHDELFIATVGKPLLIVPFIESRNNWAMRDEFPRWTDGRVAPGLVSQITNLIHRYLQRPDHPEWADKWAKVYDHNGTPRYAVVLIHAASNRLSPVDHAGFAAGFDLVANEVAQATGVQVGFFIDAVDQYANLPRTGYKSSAAFTGPYLRNTASFLGIQCFAPEIFSDASGDTDLLAWKRDFIRGWFATGIPVLVDVSPGYDGHLVFGSGSHSAYGHSDEWFDGLTALVNDYGRAGMVYNSWNGYTEAMVGVPTEELGGSLFTWLTSLNSTQAIHVDPNSGGTGWGTVSEPFQTLTAAVAEACNRDYVRVRSGNYSDPLTFIKPLTIQADGGPVTIRP